MKIKKVIFSLLVLAQPAVAQPQFRIQANAAALRTHLSNATDNASDLVTSSPKITPSGGITLSWVNPAKNGFQGIRTGLEYQWHKQTTEGGFVPPSDPAYLPNGFTSSSLHYLNVPVEARFGLAGRKGIVPFITVGVYASSLLSYKETHEQIRRGGLADTPAREDIISAEVSGKRILYDIFSRGRHDTLEGTLKEGIYNLFSFGFTGSVGLDYNIGKRHFFSFRIPIRYGLTDIERKGEFFI